MLSICTGAEKAAPAPAGSPPTEIHALLTGQERTQLTTEATTMRPREKGKPAASETNPSATDPLADALLFLAAHHGRAISREALMAGLPVLDDHLPPPLFERAAAKAGLEGKAVRRKLAEIPALVLPAVLSMRDGSTRILLAIDLDTKTRLWSTRARTRRHSRSRCTSSMPNTLASHSWCAPRPAPTRERLPRTICRARTGSGRSSASSGRTTVMWQSPR